MEMISKVSKGSAMDQIYIPKRRAILPVGSYVLIKPLEAEETAFEPVFYNIKSLEPIKITIIKEIFKITDKHTKADNIIITGSFLEKGFRFNDIDVVLITEEKAEGVRQELAKNLGINAHVITITNNALIKGLETDPLYRAMLSRCVSMNRFIYKIKPKINYKILDLHLLKSRLLIDNFKILNGSEKYDLVRNLISISLFINKKKVTADSINSAIDTIFGQKTVEHLKENTVQKDFLIKYKNVYISTRNKILR